MNSFDLHTIDLSNPIVLVGAVLVVLLIAVAIALAAHRSKKKSEALRARFGSEYDLALSEQKSRHKAEAQLAERVRRVDRLQLRELTEAERERFAARWNTVQSHFIDHPRGSVIEADEQVNAVMEAKGFPAGDFAQRVQDVSVKHARLVDSYRSANAIAMRAARNEASTEELRTAMIHFRSLFEDLLNAAPGPAVVEGVPGATPLSRTA